MPIPTGAIVAPFSEAVISRRGSLCEPIGAADRYGRAASMRAATGPVCPNMIFGLSLVKFSIVTRGGPPASFPLCVAVSSEGAIPIMNYRIARCRLWPFASLSAAQRNVRCWVGADLKSFFCTLIGNVIAFKRAVLGAVLSTLLFTAGFFFWTYYPHNLPLPNSPVGQKTAVPVQGAPPTVIAPSPPAKPNNPVRDITSPSTGVH
jgi:hypothetical protein